MQEDPAAAANALSDADRADVSATVEALGQTLAQSAQALDMSSPPEPFQATLLRHAHAGPVADPGEALAELAAGGRSSEEWIRECLRRIDTVAPARLAWREIDADAALARARHLDDERRLGRVRGPLHGVPVGLKEMFDRRGRRSGWGSAMRNDAAPAADDATIVQRLEAAGAIVLGTQHMAEFAMSPTGFNAGYGPGRNPWNTDHVSGGSSSGGGMSVGAGHVPLAIGSDTGGSIRLPAALCGVTGLKATQCRISLAGAMPLSPSLDCVGPLALSADLCAWAYAAMAGADPRDGSCLALPPPGAGASADAARRLVLAVPDVAGSALVTDEMAAAIADMRRALVDAGVRCIDVPLPDPDLTGRMGSIVLAVESAAIHRQWLADPQSGYGRQVRRRLSRGLFVRGMDYYDALRLRAPMLQAFLRDAMQGADALLLPTVPGDAPRVIDTIDRDQAVLEREFARLSAWTRGINYLGVPALNVPAGFSAAGLPLGVQFVGRPLGEGAILALGRLFQRATDWHRRTPA
jgi:aspartyl-tRNA(Asn)/glutamyl-tRNA(Gln) amidotransferase subunit A